MKTQVSDRYFGAFFSGVCVALAGYEYINSGAFLFIWSLIVLSAAGAVASLLLPEIFHPIKRGWFFLGELLGRLTSPIVLGALFFLVLSPIGIIARIMGRDVLRMKVKDARSYWVERTPANSAENSFKNQF